MSIYCKFINKCVHKFIHELRGLLYGCEGIWPKSTTHKKKQYFCMDKSPWWPIKHTYNLWTASCGILEEFSCGIDKEIIIEIPDPDPVSWVERDISETKLLSIIRNKNL